MVEMRDGVKLATDYYLPAGAGPFPVVLGRTPYGKAGLAQVGNGMRDLRVATVAQDTRGRFASEGTDCVFRCDGDGALKDGFDTMAWLQSLPAFDGHLVTVGGSAMGIVQYLAAAAAPPALDAMWVTVGTPTVFEHAFYQGGAFRQELAVNWLEGQGSGFFLQEFRDHPPGDAFWDPLQTSSSYGEVEVPTLHEGGWYDIFSQGTLDAFVGYQHQGGAGARGKQKLVMGPWTHGALHAARQGELDYPPNAVEPPVTLVGLATLWLGHYLGIQPNQPGVDALPAVTYYVMGDVTSGSAPGNTWRNAPDWPVPASQVRWYLHPGGRLARGCRPAGEELSSYSYDPEDPTPTRGGANLSIPAGPMDQRAVEERPDVLVFSSPVLGAPVEITGRVRARLYVSITTPDTDLHVRLTDVYPDGRSMLVLDGALRLAARGGLGTHQPVEPGALVVADVDLWSTSIIVNAGHRIRVSVTSSNAPRFWPNPNDGTIFGEASQPRPVEVTVHHGEAYPSHVILPDPGMGDPDTCVVEPVSDAGPGDGGPGDAGLGDAGLGDAGPVDAAPPLDAAVLDASRRDASVAPDSSAADTGGRDATGTPDAVSRDGGTRDALTPPDAVRADVGPVDSARQHDATAVDGAAAPDGATRQEDSPVNGGVRGCGCHTSSPRGLAWLAGLLGLALLRRRWG
jgi:hypothetical protein